MAITIAGSGIVSANIADGTIVSADIANGTIVAADIADNQNLGIENFVPRGLICSNDTDASHDVAISVGGVRDATNTVNMSLAAILTKRIDAAWAVGDNNGGLDGTESSGGTPDASTMYYIWLIKRSDTGVVDALYSESATGPTLPTNYDYKRLIGAVLTDASANILPFYHRGMYFEYVSQFSDNHDTTITGDTEETATLSVPPNSIAHIYASLLNDTATDIYARLHVWNADSILTTSTYFSWSLMSTNSNHNRTGGIGMVKVSGSSQVHYKAVEDSGAALVNISMIGFTMLTRNDP